MAECDIMDKFADCTEEMQRYFPNSVTIISDINHGDLNGDCYHSVEELATVLDKRGIKYTKLTSRL